MEEAKLDTVPPHVTSLLLSSKALGQSHQRDGDPVTYQMLYGVEAKGKRLSMVPSNYARDGHRKSGKGGTFVLGAGIVLPTCPPLRGTKSSHHSSGDGIHINLTIVGTRAPQVSLRITLKAGCDLDKRRVDVKASLTPGALFSGSHPWFLKPFGDRNLMSSR